MIRHIFAFASAGFAAIRSLRLTNHFPFIKFATPDWPDLLPAVIHPLIVVPGLLGTWPPALGPRGRIDPITGAYYNLMEGLTSLGYVPGVSLFSFAYDWRRGGAELAPMLAAEVKRIRKLSPKKALGRSPRPVDYSRVDLVCHSMGGVIGRAYIQSESYNGDVNRLALVAAPQQGAIAAYYAFEGGDSNHIGIPVAEARSMALLAQAADTWLPHRRIEYLYRGIRGINLPDLYLYVRDSLKSIRDFLPLKETNYLYSADESGQETLYPFGCPENSLLESLNRPENLDRLDRVKEISCYYSSTVQTLVRLKVISPSGAPLFEHGQPLNPQPATSYGPGDSIVTRESGHLALPDTKTDGSAWQVRVTHSDLGQKLNRSLNHVQIVADPDAVRCLLQDFVRAELPPLDATIWDGPPISARKPNYRALVI